MNFNKRTVFIITLIAVVIQGLIISYNHYTGYISVKSPAEAVIRLFIGTAFSSAGGVILFLIDNSVIGLLDKRFAWEGYLYRRILLEIISITATGILLGGIITVISNALFPYREELSGVMVANVLITTVINLIFTSVLEGIIIFKRNLENKFRAEKLEKENSIIRFETLINQLNPHFLFNSLNVLSALIGKDAGKAQCFIDEFSSIYRYTLDVIGRQAVTIREEIAYAKSYLYLHQIRFGGALQAEISLSADKLDCLVPPLSIQVLLENALKHNRAALESPLIIKICSDNDMLIVKNNLQPKISRGTSKGIGLENLTKRYKFVSGVLPEFTLTENEYIAKLPLIIPQ
ncbi:MAG: sensor histidine kinase [archaeon]